MKQKGFIFAIIAFGLSIRIILAQTKDFWFDEAFTFFLAKNSIPNLLTAAASDNNPPFYYLFLHFWMKLGQAEFILRLPSIIFGLLSLCLIYLVSKEIFDHKTAIFSLLLLAASPLHVYYSAEARMYSLWLFLTLVLVYCFLKILKNPKPIYYLLFILCSLLSLYTHYFSTLVLGSFAFYLVVKRREHPKLINPFILVYTLVFLAFLPWLRIFLSSPHPVSLSLTAWEGIPTTFLAFVLGGIGDITLKTMFSQDTSSLWQIIFVIFATISFGLFSLNLKNKKDRKHLPLLLIILLLPIFVTTIISLFYPIFSPRGFFAFSFAFYILLARGIASINNRFPTQSVLLLITILGLIVSFVSISPEFDREPLKKAAAFLENNYQKDDVLIHKTISTYYSSRFYHKGKLDESLLLNKNLTIGITQKGDFVFYTPEEIKQSKGRVWFISIPNRAYQEDIEEAKIFLNNKFKIAEKYQFESIEITLYKSK